jgi:hypothetical protein
MCRLSTIAYRPAHDKEVCAFPPAAARSRRLSSGHTYPEGRGGVRLQDEVLPEDRLVLTAEEPAVYNGSWVHDRRGGAMVEQRSRVHVEPECPHDSAVLGESCPPTTGNTCAVLACPIRVP